MRFFLMLLIASLCLLQYTHAPAQDNLLSALKVPSGFTITIFAKDVFGAREMALGEQDTVFVGSISAGKVYALIPDGKNSARRVITIASQLNKPNGVAYYQHDLYVAEVSRILRYRNIEQHLNDPPKPEIVLSNLPKETHHGWRFIAFGPDHKLYIGIGAPCNICERNDFPFASIMRVYPDGQHLEVFARGIRNTVGFDWQPGTNLLWFTDNGRDLMGDNIPPDELNIAYQKNLHFGFPYCHGKNIPDPEFGKQRLCSSFTPPTLELPAHVAALGMVFYTGNMFPSRYKNSIFIAEHGSWNRSQKIGYLVINVSVKGNQVTHVKPFASGWLHNEEVYGRPVDLLMLKDGSLLISDDCANVIYRVSYHA